MTHDVKDTSLMSIFTSFSEIPKLYLFSHYTLQLLEEAMYKERLSYGTLSVID